MYSEIYQSDGPVNIVVNVIHQVFVLGYFNHDSIYKVVELLLIKHVVPGSNPKNSSVEDR